jgi:hypothetical protein
MSPVRAVKNQYRGINAHLHSYFQSEGGWDSFHTNQITDLMRLMSAALLPKGYIAEIEQSLQIRRAGILVGSPESDISIYDTDSARASRSSFPRAADMQALAIPDIMTIDQELSQYRAVVIYEYRTGRRQHDEPVAWIELLSPSNKPGGHDAGSYHDKRLKLLQSGLVFVELDYLHESPSTFDRLPRYATGHKRSLPEPESHPYHIIVVDPRPVFIEGLAYPHSFNVDDPIPTVDIPLKGEDVLSFDFGAAYNKTFAETLYGARLVDYSQLPLNFERYSQDDQQRIVCRMLAVLNAASQGIDLDSNTPLPVESLTLEEGLRQLQMA